MHRSVLIVSFTLALALFARPSLTFAQSLTPAKETILFDFDNGNYDGWTLSGDCWDKQPATAKTFVDRQGNSLVTGIVGTGFLVTQFKNPTATGKAISKDFPIDKPFLTFRIGGGYFPNEACLNLVVEGKVVRTETGNDSTELRPAYWDVYALMGKTAHLEVVDATTVPNRGYIMLDDIRLTERPPTQLQTVFERMAERYREKYGSPGVWLGATVDGKIVACVAVGIRKVGSAIPANVDDVVMVGSISKPMAGTVIASLVKAGKLSWNTKFSEVCPDLVLNVHHPATEATLAHFMSHVAGIDTLGFNEFPADTGGTPTNYREQYVRKIFAKAPVGNVGEKFKYAPGVDFAAVMAERVTGKTFDNLLNEYLVRPFGLRKFGMGDRGSNQGDPTVPRGHHIDREKRFSDYGDDIQYHSLVWRSQLSGGVSCSFLDLLHFGGIWSVGGRSTIFPNSLNFEESTSVPYTITGYTRSGWGRWGGGLWHGGNTGRGEEANIQVDFPKGICFALYFNMNYPDENFALGDDLIPEMRSAIITQYRR